MSDDARLNEQLNDLFDCCGLTSAAKTRLVGKCEAIIKDACAEIASMNKKLPKLKYNIPELNEEEREIVRIMLGEQPRCTSRPSCSNCHPIMSRIFNDGTTCPRFTDNTKRKRYFDVLKDVLRQQKPLLPPHNVVQLPQEKYDMLEMWRGDKSLFDRNCPKQPCGGKSNAWSCADCDTIFTTRPENSGCPCGQFGHDAVNTIADKILAKGPKFEELDAWCRESGKKVVVFSEYGGMVHYRHENGNEIAAPASSFRNGYTTTPPPPKEEFKPYVAVRPDGEVLLITGGGPYSFYINHSEAHVTYNAFKALTDPEAAHDMLREVLGKKDMVEKIKAFCDQQCKKYMGTSGTASAFQILNFIADLERQSNT